jgi:histidinol-phosphatase (PHP family)
MTTFVVMIRTNFHTHSLFCDGKDTIEAFVEAALEHDFRRLGFSGHAPVPFENGFAIRHAALQEYCDTVRQIEQKYKNQIKVFLGLEADYIPGVTTPFIELKESCGLDYIIGSVHLVTNGESGELWFIDGPDRDIYDHGMKDLFGDDIRAAVSAYFMQVKTMIREERPQIIGHIDKIKMHNNERFFSTADQWYKDLMIEVLEAAAESGAVIEVNPRGIYKGRCEELFPGNEWLPVMKEMGIRVMLNSDAHHPDDLMKEYYNSLDAIQKAGYKTLAVWSKKGLEELEI